MKYGLPATTIEKMHAALERFPRVEKAVLYGSRAKGNYKPGSDIDLTLFGEDLDSSQLGEIATALDDLLLPYTIDLSLYAELNNAKLREHIDRVGVVFYERGGNVERSGTAGVKNGWQTKRLGDVLDVQNGYAFDSKAFNPSKGLPLIRIRSLKPGVETETRFDGEYDEKYVVRAGDLLIGMDGEFGCYEWKGEPSLLNQRVCRLLGFSGELLPRFLFYGVNDYLKAIEDITGYTTVKHLSSKQVLDIEFPVPPLAEQQRIVGLLDEAFEGLAKAKANAEKNLQNARALFESHLQSVFTQRGPGWVETTLGEIGKVSMCKRIFKEETTANGDIPFYKIGTFGKETDAFIPIQTYNEYRAKYSFPKKGDVLISAAGTIGRRVRYDGEPAYFQDSNIVWIDNDEKQALNDYLYHFYGACAWNSTNGATIPRLYNDNLRRISIGFPKSFQEQRRIVAQLDALSEETQRLARLYEQKLAALEELKKALLHKAFAGEL